MGGPDTSNWRNENARKGIIREDNWFNTMGLLVWLIGSDNCVDSIKVELVFDIIYTDTAFKNIHKESNKIWQTRCLKIKPICLSVWQYHIISTVAHLARILYTEKTGIINWTDDDRNCIPSKVTTSIDDGFLHNLWT